MNHHIMHPYRLVISNSCNGYSKDWANAFGFAFQYGGSQYTINDYNYFGREPQAFVAWEPRLAAPDNTWADSIDRYAELPVDFDGRLAERDSLGLLHGGLYRPVDRKIDFCIMFTTRRNTKSVVVLI